MARRISNAGTAPVTAGTPTKIPYRLSELKLKNLIRGDPSPPDLENVDGLN
jgi:hypothetical protein